MSSTNPKYRRPIYFGFGIAVGGVPSFSRQLAKAAQLLGLRSFTVYGPQAGYSPILRSFGLNEWKFAWLSLFRLGSKRWINRSLVHLHTRSLLLPDVYTVHGLYTKYWRQNPKQSLPARIQFQLLSHIEKRLLCKARKVVFVSQGNRDYVEQELGIRRPEAFSVVHPGVDCEKFSPSLRSEKQAQRQKLFPEIPANSRWLLFVGNDFAGKGLFRILPALTNAPASPWQLLVFGKDPANMAAAQIAAKELKNPVVFFPEDGRLREAFGLSDALVIDSLSEGYPLVLLEAMAAGCIPFTTQFDGSEEAITEGKTGFRFPDSASLVQAAISTPEAQLATMAALARQFALTHSWERVAQQYETLYEALD